ncbi:Conserved_hypothetical protein [Hexamita inflata]|uniref:C2H2-type domain-containing protein n=1 Tax=Hexamita inflata TaxID=28002 RepID=A0AA86V188_9EUKA|nr:Conserved hypothetical protein [Hexamita inflata]
MMKSHHKILTDQLLIELANSQELLSKLNDINEVDSQKPAEVNPKLTEKQLELLKSVTQEFQQKMQVPLHYIHPSCISDDYNYKNTIKTLQAQFNAADNASATFPRAIHSVLSCDPAGFYRCLEQYKYFDQYPTTLYEGQQINELVYNEEEFPGHCGCKITEKLPVTKTLIDSQVYQFAKQKPQILAAQMVGSELVTLAQTSENLPEKLIVKCRAAGCFAQFIVSAAVLNSDFSSESDQLYLQHMQHHCGASPYRCNTCFNKLFNGNFSTSQLILNSIVCEQFYFDSLCSYLVHLQKHQKVLYNYESTENFKCLFCPQIGTEAEIIQHLKTHSNYNMNDITVVQDVLARYKQGYSTK